MLLERREAFGPREYPEADDFMIAQTQCHWHHLEMDMERDKRNWNQDLTQQEKMAVERTLNGFVQAEVVINDYWARKVTKWFPKPEIAGMASTFAAMENIHMSSYAYRSEERRVGKECRL